MANWRHTVHVFDGRRDYLGWSSLSWHFLQVLLRGDAFELFCLSADRVGNMGLLRIVSRDDVDLVIAHVMVSLDCASCRLLCLIGLLAAKLVCCDLVVPAYRPYVSIAARALAGADGHLLRSCPLDFLLLHWKLVHRCLLLGLEVGLLHSVAVRQIWRLPEAGDRLLLLLFRGRLLSLVSELSDSERCVIITV